MDHLSWERSNLTTNSTTSYSKSSDHSFNKKTYHHSRSRKDKLSTAKLDLLAFGYSCKLFDDDNQAKYLDQGKSLVPWCGNNNLLIDRFDVRNYLNQNELDKYEAKIDTNNDDELTEKEIEFEKKLDKERYNDLYDYDNKIEPNEIQNKQIDHDEELRKWKESIEEEDNKKNDQFQFNYDNLEPNYKNKNNQPVQNINNNQHNLEDDKEFILPDNLNLPSDVNLKLPTTMREHNLIEKTAKFISKQNVQMEIILKTKQSSNSQFDFLNYDAPLNPYYKYLLKLIKEGIYKPKDNNTEDKNETDDESDEDNYLHPSLQSSKSTTKLQNTYDYNTNYNLSTNLKPSSYSKLAENLKDKIVINDKSYYESKVIENKAIKYDLNKNDNDSSKLTSSSSNTNNNQLNLNQPKVKSVFELIPEVPDETKIIIEKLAQYVSKNGDEFEKTVKGRNEDRFDFLNPGHKFHFYYVQTKLKLLEEKRKKEKKIESTINKLNNDSIKSNNLDNQNKVINEFDSNQKITPFIISNKRQTFKDDLELKLKEKQEERKRKAALFLSKLKSQKGNDEQTDDENKIFGPQLPLELQQPQKSKESENYSEFRNTPSPLKVFFNDIKEDNSSFNRTEFRKENFNSNNAMDDLLSFKNSNDVRRSNSIERRSYRSSSIESRHRRSRHNRSISRSRSRSRSISKLYRRSRSISKSRRSRSRSIGKLYQRSRSISKSRRSRSRSIGKLYQRSRSRSKSKRSRSKSIDKLYRRSRSISKSRRSRSRSIGKLYRRSRSRSKSKRKRSRSHRKKSHKSYRSRSRSLSRHRRKRSHHK